MIRYSLEINGTVQGVGFRPFVFRLAKKMSLSGFVRNTTAGVYIEIEGKKDCCEVFILELKSNPPSLAYIKTFNILNMPVKGEHEFKILSSEDGTSSTFISPDIGICDDCAAEIIQSDNRRFNYAFTNCTNCGPRFTILKDIPYDRENTTMNEFLQCADCRLEYENPYDRRFHAQPNACSVCGPKLSFYRDGIFFVDNPFEKFNETIKNDGIIVLKGIGGFHFVCDAKNEKAVIKLRNKKKRYDKPFAVMMRDLNTVQKYCNISEEEKKALLSFEKPIVLLTKKDRYEIAASVTFINTRLGVMLPYTPLHLILMKNHEALVMTSGNLSDNPMIFDDQEVMLKFSSIADGILTHDRKIHRRMDDSVCMVINNKKHMIRRARGYVPKPIHLNDNKSVILAVGAQQNNTFCLAKDENAFLSGHIGDMDNLETFLYFENEVKSFIKIFSSAPKVIACDMHPDYTSTRFAYSYDKKIPVFQIQHHHAHFASVMAEHKVYNDNAIGIIFDGTGYGTDGCIWGGEVLYGNLKQSTRSGHLLYFPLMGGESAIKEPWRIAMAITKLAMGKDVALSLFPEYKNNAEILFKASERMFNSPKTSSMGRLFDGVAALIGVRKFTSYEGQAAIELQQIIDNKANGCYDFEIIKENDKIIFDWRPMVREIILDINKGEQKGTISLKFHNCIINLIVTAAVLVRDITKCNKVALSGGVFQNDYLLENVIPKLNKKGFVVYTNEKIPTNDGGISFGQAAAVSYKLR